jgi:hypothetical protein
MALDASYSAANADQFDPSKIYDVSKLMSLAEAHSEVSPLQKEALDLQAAPIVSEGTHEYGFSNIAQNLVKGATKEVFEHPGKLATNVALGVSLGYAAKFGLQYARTPTMIGLAVGGAYGAYEFASNIPQWKNDFAIAYDPFGSSVADVQAAELRIQRLGANALELAVIGYSSTLPFRTGFSAASEAMIAKTRNTILGGVGKAESVFVPARVIDATVSAATKGA